MISAKRSPELQATIFRLKTVNAEIRKTLYRAARQTLRQAWTEELAGRASSSLQERVLVAGARTTVSTQGFKVTTAKQARALSGGFVPAKDWPAAEFGAKWRRAKIRTTSTLGKAFIVSKVINKQLKPRNRKGYVAMPAANDIGIRLVSLWVQVIAREYHNASEGK